MLRFGNQVGNQNQQPLNEPDAEPVVDDSADMDVDATHEMPSSSAGAPQHVPPADQVLTAENFVAWMLERCRRRMSQANDQNTEESSTSKEPTYSLDLGLLWFPPMLLFVIQQEGLWETCQTSVTMCGHPTTSRFMDQQALDKRNEPLLSSMRFNMDQKIIQVSVRTWIWLQMPLQGMLHSHHTHQLRVQAKEKRDQKQWSVT